jgi:hypothetical protein
MKKSTLILACLSLLMLIGFGCEPEQLVVWSPDGTRAAVIGPDGLYLSNPAGKLTGLLIKDVRKVAWFSDSKRIAAAREVKVKTWKEAVAYLEPERAKRLENEAEKLFKDMMAQEKLSDEYARKVLEAPDGPEIGEFLAMVLYIGEKHAEELKKKVTEEEWQKFNDGSGFSVMLLQVYELGADSAREGVVLASSFLKISDIRPSPTNSVIAYVAGDGSQKELWSVWVVPSDGKAQPRRVADLCARFVDWSIDGKYVGYARANPPKVKITDTLRLGTLRRMQVCEADGTLRAQPFADEVTREVQPDGSVNETPSPADSLAGIIFNEWTKVRCLRDGRILFVSCEVELPVTSDDVPTRLTLFALDPAKQATVSRVFSRRIEGEVGDALQFFEVNADQTLVATPGSDGRMVVVSLNGANVMEVVGKKDGRKMHMVPSWRSSDELCFALTNEGDAAQKRPAEVYLWRQGQEAKLLSKEWGDEVVAALKVN